MFNSPPYDPDVQGARRKATETQKKHETLPLFITMNSTNDEWKEERKEPGDPSSLATRCLTAVDFSLRASQQATLGPSDKPLQPATADRK